MPALQAESIGPPMVDRMGGAGCISRAARVDDGREAIIRVIRDYGRPRLGETIGGFGGSGWRSITGWKSRDHPAGDQRRSLPAGGHRVRLQYRRAKPDSSLLIPESTAVDSGHEVLDIQPNGPPIRWPCTARKALICGCPRARQGRLYFMQRAPSCIVDYRIGTDACSFGIASRGHRHRPSRLD